MWSQLSFQLIVSLTALSVSSAFFPLLPFGRRIGLPIFHRPFLRPVPFAQYPPIRFSPLFNVPFGGLLPNTFNPAAAAAAAATGAAGNLGAANTLAGPSVEQVPGGVSITNTNPNQYVGVTTNFGQGAQGAGNPSGSVTGTLVGIVEDRHGNQIGVVLEKHGNILVPVGGGSILGEIVEKPEGLCVIDAQGEIIGLVRLNSSVYPQKV